MAKKEREIKYSNRDFNDFRTSLIEMAKSYFPDTYNDFSDTSPGMMFIEMAAYVGDVLSFYQDTQLQETFLNYAQDKKNLFNLAYMMGYKPKITGVSEVELTVSCIVPANASDSYNPNWAHAVVVNPNSVITSTDKSNTDFITTAPVDFQFSSSYDPTEVIINSISSGNPAEYTLKKKVKAFSGTVKSSTYEIDSSEKFKTLTVSDTNIVGILDITGSSGDTYYEVPFLGQDTVFVDTTNGGADKGQVPYVLNLRKAPKRFTTRLQSNNDLKVQFGAGTYDSDDSTLLPDPTNVGSGTNQGIKRIDNAWDPSNFTFSRAYGIAPNEDLLVRYITGGGVSANVPANTISTKSGASINLRSNASADNVTFNNLSPAKGGREGDTVTELRENSLRSFNEQGRAVTLQDYTIRSLSLPSKFGSIGKVFVTQDKRTNTNLTDGIVDNNPLALSVYVLAYDNNKNLTTASSTLKQNLKTYLSEWMVLSDSVNIKDAFVVNIGVNYEIIVRPNYTGRNVLLDCNLVLQDYFDISKRNINQTINLAELFVLIDKVKGVQTVQKVEIVNKTTSDGAYSQYGYDIAGATRSSVIYPSYDPCIFEIKYPTLDIKGRITIL